jgi:hypothetical protein
MRKWQTRYAVRALFVWWCTPYVLLERKPLLKDRKKMAKPTQSAFSIAVLVVVTAVFIGLHSWAFVA